MAMRIHDGVGSQPDWLQFSFFLCLNFSSISPVKFMTYSARLVLQLKSNEVAPRLYFEREVFV